VTRRYLTLAEVDEFAAGTLAPRLVDYEIAARYLGIPVGTLRSMVCRRQIPHVRLSARVVRFELAALDAVIEERRVDVPRREARDLVAPSMRTQSGRCAE
jgi:excisionase family DNA binding protein